MIKEWGLLGTLRHFACLVFGIALMAASVALAKIALLGTSPISSIPNVLSGLTRLSIGQWTIFYMFLLVSLEWLVLRRYFGWSNVIQLIPSIFFGTMIDWFVQLFKFIKPTGYWLQLGLTLISIVLLAIGVFFEVNSQTLMMAGEGIAAAIAFRRDRPFAKTKVRVDMAMVLGAVLISLIFSRQLIGVREGTILSALLSGRIVGYIEERFPQLTAWLRRSDPELSSGK
ncbi:integral membrane protein [Lapidilactobacillus dextrinicus DSM 20335]|uniref:Integral membrane protein n=1 Tax=Lapidilactobacillus dextrinicus DSM 20335 TaxID=1423738 RepID=A0A0R2BG91_9LACO|nr:DUF6198 family protein [Lapidilactobacillus dextrinicus]KRM78231.1 integral membrane protein [Lapidilactobacillus dextrinicus DSM 20335]QFG47184.1 hypothetical protein LH506_06860 [Lapidilactobacillus dextrinicus]